ncbi:MAG: hypothetical protein Cons2KO_34180 [Congregibacter sp.]
MLLRRVSQHLKDQNWTAVVIDFFIVVIGVFVGLQVQEWYADRALRIADGKYMQRLQGEVEELLNIRENVVAPRTRNFENLALANQKLYGNPNASPLTEDECAAIQLSHVFINPTGALPTVDELLASGRLDNLSSPTVKRAIVDYRQTTARAEGVIEAVNAGVLILSRKYPSLISLDGSSTEVYGLIVKSPRPSCDLQAMRNDQGFLNDLADNMSRFEAYYLFVLSEPSERLSDLKSALAVSLRD